MFGINKTFEDHLETVALEFRENLDKYRRIISVHHTDADGICSGLIVAAMIQSLNKRLTQMAFNLDRPWKAFLADQFADLTGPSAIIFSDLGPSGVDLCDFIETHPETDIYILDHHLFRPDPARSLPDNVYNANPTQFGLHGLKEIIGATLNYLFAKAVDSRNLKLAWLAVLGMGGDTLDHINDYRNYNRAVVEEAAEHGQVVIHEGLCLFGGQFERIDRALSLSILPYIPQAEGDVKKAQAILAHLGIDPKTKVPDLSPEDQERISQYLLLPSLRGEYVSFPKKTGVLQFAFEHAQLVSILGANNIQHAKALVKAPRASPDVKAQYYAHMGSIVANLTTFFHMPKHESPLAIVVDLTGRIPPAMWSDTGSFATINRIYDMNKPLLIGGLTPEGNYKLSVRCSQEFVIAHGGQGVNVIIKKITETVGGDGGGHGLAGGLRIPKGLFPALVAQIDGIIAGLNSVEHSPVDPGILGDVGDPELPESSRKSSTG